MQCSVVGHADSKLRTVLVHTQHEEQAASAAPRSMSSPGSDDEPVNCTLILLGSEPTTLKFPENLYESV